MDPARLTNIAIFSELDGIELARLAAFASEVTYGSGAKLLGEGEFSTELYAIEQGTANIVRNGKRIDTVGAGDVVGEMGVLGKAQRNADVVATSTVVALKISHWEIKRLSAPTIARIRAIIESRAARGLPADQSGR